MAPTPGDAPQAAPAPAADATAAALAVAAVPDPDGGYGFQHAELGNEKLVGSVGFYERHVFLCYKGPDVWPSHLEAAESDRLPRLLAAAIKARKPSLKKTMGLSEEQQKQALELRSMINGGKVIRIDGASCNPAAAGGCCQGNGDQKKEKQDKSITAEQNPRSSEENDKAGGGAGSKKRNTKICPMSTRFETWERADQYPAPRTKWSKLPLSPARDMEWRSKPTSHRPNPHQGRKGSPSIFYRDWSPALRGKENEQSTSECFHRPLSHKEMGRSPLMELTPNERDIRGRGRIGPQAEREINWSKRGLRVRPQGEQVSQVFHHTPYWKSTGASHSQRRTEWNENWRPTGVSHSENQRWTEWNEKDLKRARGEWEVGLRRPQGEQVCHRPRGPYWNPQNQRNEWNERERARGEREVARVKERRHTLQHMLYSSRIITSSPRLRQEEYDKQPVEIKSPSYNAHSD